MQEMTDSQRTIFQSEFNQTRKHQTTAFFLTLFLGGIGAHRFYLDETALGLVYLVFCWTFIPVVISLFELLLIAKRVDRYNTQLADEVALRVKAMTPA